MGGLKLIPGEFFQLCRQNPDIATCRFFVTEARRAGLAHQSALESYQSCAQRSPEETEKLMVAAALEFGEKIKYVNETYEDTLTLAKELEVEGIREQVISAWSFQALFNLHDDLTEQINSRNIEEEAHQFKVTHGRESFPPPFLPGNETIQPVATISELLKEGAVMRHCVASHSEEIMWGRCFIYRVLAPERATLEVVREGGKLSMGQCRGMQNESISQVTATVILDWFEGEMGKAQANLRPGEKMGA